MMGSRSPPSGATRSGTASTSTPVTSCQPARGRLGRLCRYVLRPPVVSERLQVCHNGQVLWRLPRPWRDGTTQVTFDPCDFLGRLAVLVPRPRVNLLFYHGVLGARSAWRRVIVPGPAAEGGEAWAAVSAPPANAAPTLRRHQWADLMRRSFGVDVLACDRRGGRLRLIALVPLWVPASDNAPFCCPADPR
jgi:hypothetical protein